MHIYCTMKTIKLSKKILYIFIFSFLFIFSIPIPLKTNTTNSYIIPKKYNEQTFNIHTENLDIQNLLNLYNNKKILVLTFDDGHRKIYFISN